MFVPLLQRFFDIIGSEVVVAGQHGNLSAVILGGARWELRWVHLCDVQSGVSIGAEFVLELLDAELSEWDVLFFQVQGAS